MALSWGNRGGGTSTSGSTSLACSPTTNFAVGDFGIFVISYDNSAASGADPYSGGATVNDSKGNTWTWRQTIRRSPGNAVGDGVCDRIFTATIGTALLTTDNLTITFSISTTSKGYGFGSVTSSTTAPYYVTGGTTSGAGTAFTMTTGSCPVGNVTVCHMGLEANTGPTGDVDTTNGSWSNWTDHNASTGTSATSIYDFGQRKIQTTAASAQTWDFTVANTDWAATWIQVGEAVNATAAPATNAVGVMGPKTSPSSDVANPDSWTTTPLWSKVVADDGDEISTPTVSAATTADFGLAAVMAPTDNARVQLRVRAKHTGSPGAMLIGAQIYEGATLRASSIGASVIATGTSYTTGELRFTAAEIATITSWSALTVRLTASPFAATGAAQFSYLILDVPGMPAVTATGGATATPSTVARAFTVPTATATGGTGGPPVTGFSVWYDASDTSSITSSAGAVSQWNDKSGNANHMTQATGTNKPTTGARTINSLNVLDFDGADDYMTGTTSLGLTTETRFVVLQSDDTVGSGGKMWIDSGVGGSNRHLMPYQGSTWRRFAGIDIDHLFAVTTNACIQSATFSNNAADNLWLNGVAASNPQTAGTDTCGILTVGSRYDHTNAANGAIAEIIVYPSVLNSTDRQSVESYLSTKWGVSLAGANATPSTVARSFTVGTASVTGDGNAAPATVARAFTVPTAAASGSGAGTATPSTVARAFTVGTATATGSAVATPATVGGGDTAYGAGLYGAGVYGGAGAGAGYFTVNPATATGTGSGAGTATPATVARSFTVGTATATGTATAAPASVARSFTIPTATATGTAGGNATAAPNTVARSFTVNPATATGTSPNATATPSTITRSFTIPTAAASGGIAYAPPNDRIDLALPGAERLELTMPTTVQHKEEPMPAAERLEELVPSTDRLELAMPGVDHEERP